MPVSLREKFYLRKAAKARHKVIAVRLKKDRRTQNTSAVTHYGGGGGSVPAVQVSMRRESGPLPGASDMAQVVAGPIPLAGPMIQAGIGALLTTIKTIDMDTTLSQTKAVIDGLKSRLSRLSRHLGNAPAARDGSQQLRRDELTSIMRDTSDRLKKLDKRSIFITQAIIGCSGEIQQYLDDYKFSVQIEGCEIQVQQFGTLAAIHLPGTVIPGSFILVDATGYQHEIPLKFGMSLQQVNKILEVLFEGDSQEAHIQRQYVEQGEYDLCIDRGTQVIELTGQRNEWPTIEAGMNIIMRAILRKPLRMESSIQCDSCGHSNFSLHSIHIDYSYPNRNWIVHCRECERRYQVSLNIPSQSVNPGTNIPPHTKVKCDQATKCLIRNMHIRESFSEDRRKRSQLFEELELSRFLEEDVFSRRFLERRSLARRRSRLIQISQQCISK